MSKPFTFSAGAVIVASEHNNNFDTLYNLVNGSLSSANLASNAAIVDTQLAQITTAAKVSTTALTIASQATGDLIYASASNTWARLGIGTAKQGLIGGTNPAWSSNSPFAGSVVQVVNTESGAVATGTTVIPYDDTIPQITEGDQYMTLAITPTNASNKLKIDVVCHIATHADACAYGMVALFQDATAGALAAAISPKIGTTGNDHPDPIVFTHYMAAGTTSSTTFRVRAGFDQAGTTTFNGANGSRLFGGVLASSITITEIVV